MSSGLIALIDDITALAKLAAASLDDVATQTTKASSKAISKAAGIVIDDAAVTPKYVVGLAAQRELPIISKIALGSLKNKLLFLLPGALFLSFVLPWLITPLLMLGGTFLCYEGWHKLKDTIGFNHNNANHELHEDNAINTEKSYGEKSLEDERIKSAIRTDFILSAEIMAITLDTVASSPLWQQGSILAVSGIAMTFIVYGTVAIIVKADDFGSYLAHKKNLILKKLGRSIVFGMPFFLQILSQIGMLAMLWVGGGIITHGLHVLGIHSPEDTINQISQSAIFLLGSAGSWFIKASISAIVGLLIGILTELFLVKTKLVKIH